MDPEKTGRLIAKRREEMGLTQEKLSELLLCTPKAVSAWENGKRYPGPASQELIDKVMGLNPVELLKGTRMYDDKLKEQISHHMSKPDEKVFTGGIVTDEDGNESYLDMSGFSVVTTNEDGELSDKWIPYLEYYNEKPHEMTDREKELKAEEDAIPKEDYNPTKVYINCSSAIFIISRETLEAVGKPRFFEICQDDKEEFVGFKFGESGTFDIPDEVYGGNGPQGEIHDRQGTCKGLLINGGEFGADLCRKMGISRLVDSMAVVPTFSNEHNMLVLDLIEAQRVKVKLDLNDFVLPTWQFEEEMRELEEEEEEEEE